MPGTVLSTGNIKNKNKQQTNKKQVRENRGPEWRRED